MLNIKDFLTLPENSEIICYCRGESELCEYTVFYLSNNELLILTHSKESHEINHEYISWFKNYKILALQFSLSYNFLHFLTTNNTYIIIPFHFLLDKQKHEKWEEYVLINENGNIDINKQSDTNYKGIFSSLKNFLIKKHSNDNFNEKEKNVDPNTEINKKELSFFEITEKKLLNFDDYKNIINFDEFQNITFEGIGEYYKGLSAFCLWKNSLDDEYCIISTLAGGLIFLKLNDGNHYLFYVFPFGIEEMILIQSATESYLILNSDIGVYLYFPLEKEENKNIIDSYGNKEFKPFFLNFGNSAKVFSYQIKKKTKLFVYQENDGNLLIFNKKNLKTPEKSYYLKTSQMIKVLPWNNYFLTLSFENCYKMKLVSKTVLQLKKKIQNDQNGKELIQLYNMNLLKYAEIFSQLELSGIEHTIDIFITFVENSNENIKNNNENNRLYLNNALLITNKKIYQISLNLNTMLNKFLQKLDSNFNKEDFLCYEIFVKTHYSNHHEIFQQFWNKNKAENKFEILFYIDVYRRTNNKGHIIKMMEDYMNLKNVEVYKNILNYIIKEQNNAFDTFWIICVLFYSFYFNYFTISFEKFLGNMLDLKGNIMGYDNKEDYFSSTNFISEKPLFYKNMQNSFMGTYNLTELFGFMHNILFLYEIDFRKKFDYSDYASALFLFGGENKYNKLKWFALIETQEKPLSFFENIILNSFYFDKPKKIIFYVYNALISPENELLLKNVVTHILSVNLEEAEYLLSKFLKKYKLLYKHISFLNENSCDDFLNDTHIFDVSPNVIKHFLELVLKTKPKDVKFFNINENSNEYLIKKFEKQMSKIFDSKRYFLVDKLAQIIAILCLKYCSLKKNNECLFIRIFPLIKKIMKKNQIINICIRLNLLFLLKESSFPDLIQNNQN